MRLRAFTTLQRCCARSTTRLPCAAPENACPFTAQRPRAELATPVNASYNAHSIPELIGASPTRRSTDTGPTRRGKNRSEWCRST